MIYSTYLTAQSDVRMGVVRAYKYCTSRTHFHKTKHQILYLKNLAFLKHDDCWLAVSLPPSNRQCL